jgi:tetratricopeptide (TPR) repeat protein
MDRVEALKAMLAQDPANTFARYGLAQEYARGGEYESAIAEYGTLLAANPDYAAAYYHAGQALEKLNRPDDARQMYQRGIEVTTRTGDMHTRSELQGVLDMLG